MHHGGRKSAHAQDPAPDRLRRQPRLPPGAVREPVELRHPEPRDRRHTRIWLTGQGIALHDRVTPHARRSCNHFESLLEPHELHTLLALLGKVRGRADNALEQRLEEIA
jgi:hypothetical protein